METHNGPMFISFDGSVPKRESFSRQEQYVRLIILFAGQITVSKELATLYMEPGDIAILRAEDNWQVTGNGQSQYVNLFYQIDFLAPAVKQFMLKLGFRVLFQFEPSHSRLTQPAETLWSEMTAGFQPTAAAQEKRFSQVHLSLSEAAEVMAICSEINKELTSKVPYYEVMLLSQILRMMTIILRSHLNSLHQQEAPENDQAVRRVVQLLTEEYAKPWQLDEMCAAAHMSKSKFSNMFHEMTGKTPIEFLIFIRLSNATQLLRNTEKNITDIAYAVGFSDSNYFSRIFKKYAGISPSSYRKQLHSL